MIKFNIKDVGSYSIPTGWHEVKISTFKEFLNYTMNNTDKENGMDSTINLVSMFSAIDKDTIGKLSYVDYNKLVEALSFIFKPLEDKPVLRFKIDDIEYGFQYHVTDMNVAEFSDLDNLSKEELFVKNIDKISAILYRPIIKSESETEYTIEKYNTDSLLKRAKLFNEKLTVDKFYSGMVFLAALELSLSEVTLEVIFKKQMMVNRIESFKNKVRRMFRLQPKTSTIDGDCTQQLLELQEASNKTLMTGFNHLYKNS